MQFNRKGVQRKHKEKADFRHQMTVKKCSQAQSISLPCFDFFQKRNFSAVKLMKNTCTKYVCAHSTEFFVLIFHFCTQLFAMEASPCFGISCYS